MRTLFKKLLGILLVLAISMSTLNAPAKAIAASKTANRKAVLKIVNSERKKAGCGKLVLDSKLSKAAQKRAQEIEKYFAHDRPDGSNCFTVLAEYNASYTTCGENIAAGHSTAATVMNSWMNSEGHKKNILTKSFKKMGVGYYKKKGSAYTYYWVQLFSD